MNLSPGLISDFVKVTNDKQEKKETTIYATVVSQGDSLYAQFDGSELLTPIDSTIKVKDGDRVLVTVRNHAATIIGSTTSPAASNFDLEETSGKIGNLDLLIADKAEVSDLEAIIARIERLIAEDVVIGGRLTATEGYIKQLEADNLIVNGKIVGAEAEIEFVKADKLSVKEADIKYANIDFANIDEAWVEKLFVTGSFLVDDINAATGSFSKYLTGVNIVGDNITAGTIATDRLVIRDPDTNTGILFAINNGIVAQEGLSEEALKRMTLNGQVITAQSITADKINVTDLFAQYIEASNLHITGDSTFNGRLYTTYDGNSVEIFDGRIVSERSDSTCSIYGAYANFESRSYELSKSNTGYDSYTKKILIGSTEFKLRHSYFRNGVPSSVDFASIDVDGARLPSLDVLGNVTIRSKTMRIEGEGDEEPGNLTVEGSIYSDGPIYVGNTEVSLEGHEHSWVKTNPTAGSGVTIKSSYCAYNTALNMGMIRLSLEITPTVDIEAGDPITVATLTGDVVPGYICALSAYAGSSASRRWMAGITNGGNVNARANVALTKGTTYSLYICGAYPRAV